jgi:3-hydroxyisobutyrate dehydrogenase
VSIGYVGLGNMGGALATRLLMTHPLVVFDRAESACRALAAAGAAVAEDLPALAARCDLIFFCLPTSDHVREAIFGASGLSAGLRSGTLLVDQTTGDPNITRTMAADLASRGIDLIDAPVSGGRQGAQAGTIAIMVGASHEQYGRVEPVLKAISPNVFHAGGVGNGHVVKLVNNLMSTAQRLLSFEAVSLAARNGVDPKTAVEMLLASGGRNAYLEKIMAPRVLNGKLDIGFTLGLAHKDVRLACQLGQASDVPMFFGNLTRELYQVCIAEMGRDSQVDTVGLVFDRMAGTQVVPAENDIDAAPLTRRE